MARKTDTNAPDDLFVVYLDVTSDPDATLESPSTRKLAPGLYLVRSNETRSKLYHQIKCSLRPEALFVARLDGDPKFKGMEAGALKWLRTQFS